LPFKYVIYTFQSLELPVVDMRMRHVNLEAHLHTNERYETYFKRRIANIVSSYCEHQANECLGTSLRLTQSDDDGDDKSVLYATEDESEPLLTQNNVVLLRVEREPANVTRVLFAITKSENVGSLNEQMIIDPVKVKYILGSQAGPLARILGGIKLDSVRVSRIQRHLESSYADNTKLIAIISVVGAFFVICYIIGAIRLYRDARRRKRERKANENMNGLTSATSTPVPNYGSCQRKPSTNGAVLKVMNPLQEETPIKHREIDDCVGNCQPEESHVLTERQARLMFMCDPSQLPREPTFDFQVGLDNSEPPQSTKSNSSREDVIDEEGSPSQKRDAPTLNEVTPPVTLLNRSTSDPDVPALVLVPSMSLDSPITSDISSNVFATQSVYSRNEPESPPDRPKSRRGSRIGDEILDLREITAPMENEGNHSMELFTREFDRNAEKNRTESEMSRWSSGEGELDVYYKLSDEDDTIRGDDWTTKPVGASNNYALGNDDYESDSEGDDEHLRYGGDMDSYVYERLREELTPVPPPDS
uniref:Cadherin domain-containing protein n=1 Tax=Angiostrongylus cantonensis TaxID=6313 RepID=A0A158PAY1_ANGCA